MYSIYHNPRCSKSRETLKLLEAANVEINIIEYLKQPPTLDQLTAIAAMLGLSDVRAMMRTKEDAYKALQLNNTELGQQELLQAIHDNPKLLERPIVVNNDRAVIGRPPENVNKLLNN